MELKQFYSNRTSYHLTSVNFNLQNFTFSVSQNHLKIQIRIKFCSKLAGMALFDFIFASTMSKNHLSYLCDHL